MRAAVTFLTLHEKDLVFGRPQYFRRFGDRGSIDPVFGIHEKLPAGTNDLAGLLHFGHHALIHELLRYVLSDGDGIARRAEITGKRFFADDMFAGAHGIHDHGRMQRGRGTNVDNVNFLVSQQAFVVLGYGWDLMLLGEVS